MRIDGRPDHIEDYLANLHSGTWFEWTDPDNKIYANLKLADKVWDQSSEDVVNNPYSKPSEIECNNGLQTMQDEWDLENDSYKSKRRAEYPKLAEQFDLLYKDIVAGTVTTNGDFAKAIKAVKDKHSKG